MAFISIDKKLFAKLWKVHSENVISVNFQFLAEVPVSKACSGRNCVLGELITDSQCSLTDHKCGPNMVFKTLIGPMRVKAGLSSYKICFQQCTCYSSEYKKKGGQCIKGNSVPMRNETEVLLITDFRVPIIWYN